MKKAVLVLTSFLFAGVSAGRAQDVPDEARKQLVEALGGGPFLVFRDKVQEELKLSDQQKQKLLETFPAYVQETMKVFETIQGSKPEKRDKAMQEHRQKSHQKLAAALKDILEARQQERLMQLQLQQAGPFALLGQGEVLTKLKITDEQRKKFMDVVRDMQQKIQATIKDAGQEPKPEELMPKVMKIRQEHAGKIEAQLTETQKNQWKELLGKAFDLGD